MITAAPTLTQLFDRLRLLIVAIVPTGTPVLRGPLNRVPQPKVDHVIMTELFAGRLRTNVDTYNDGAPESQPGEKLIEMGTALNVQVDFYGAAASAWATAFETLFRDEYAVDAMMPVAAPLYADESRMIPLVTGEEQFLSRWTTTAHFQYNPQLIVPQQFADQLEIALAEVDVEFPPA